MADERALAAHGRSQLPYDGDMHILLVSPYELGRQPFSLAHPAALLRARGHSVALADLALGSMPWETLARFDLIGIVLGMHTATRIAISLLPRIRATAPKARLVCYGLYGPPNADVLTRHGVDYVLGPEFETELLRLVGDPQATAGAAPRVRFVVPDRTGLPALSRYAHLVLPDGARKTVGFVEASRGCKYLCRQCPIVPVYEGRFRAIPPEVVIADAAQQIAQGANHLSFGDPDFLNGPTHALRILETLHKNWPTVTFDATVKISHILIYEEIMPRLSEYGCLFLTSAAESFDDAVLALLDKGHSAQDIDQAVRVARDVGIALTPTFVPFTPWTTPETYLELLTRVRDLGLINSVTPIQLVIRLLVPEGSRLLDIPGFRERLGRFSGEVLGYPWTHADPRVDSLQSQAQRWVEQAEGEGRERFETFSGLWSLAHESLGRKAPALKHDQAGPVSPHLSEPWYCCAEPTAAQLAECAVGG